MDQHQKFMRKAIGLSVQNLKKGGGPFGAVIVKDNKVIATGVNRVTSHNDPTAHAEIVAIRSATRKLHSFNIKGCTIYTSCEPCPMCLAAIYWAHLDKIYYANTKTDAKNIGFDDSFIYDEIALDPNLRKIETTRLLAAEAITAFERWTEMDEKMEY